MKKSADNIATQAASWRRGQISPSGALNGYKDIERKLKILYGSVIRAEEYLNSKDKNKKHKRPPCDKRPCTNRLVDR